MNEAFILLSGLRFIDKYFILMARNFFWIFTENKPVQGLRNIPGVNWLKSPINSKYNCILLEYYNDSWSVCYFSCNV